MKNKHWKILNKAPKNHFSSKWIQIPYFMHQKWNASNCFCHFFFFRTTAITQIIMTILLMIITLWNIDIVSSRGPTHSPMMPDASAFSQTLPFAKITWLTSDELWLGTTCLFLRLSLYILPLACHWAREVKFCMGSSFSLWRIPGRHHRKQQPPQRPDHQEVMRNLSKGRILAWLIPIHLSCSGSLHYWKMVDRLLLRFFLFCFFPQWMGIDPTSSKQTTTLTLTLPHVIYFFSV